MHSLTTSLLQARSATLVLLPLQMLMTAGVGPTERDEKKELLYGLMGEPSFRNAESLFG
jgi:hypothetical protein